MRTLRFYPVDFLVPLLLSGSVVADDCVIVRSDPRNEPIPYISIKKPGNYCLDRDYKFVCYPWMHGCSGAFIEIRADDVNLNMRGHSLRAFGTVAYDGINVAGERVSVRNGSITGVGMAMHISGRQGSPPYSRMFDKYSAFEVFLGGEGVIVENMDLSVSVALGPALYVVTNKVKLRESRVNGTLAVTGAGHIIEDNIIELHAPEPAVDGRNMYRYAVLVRGADGLEFRRNTIKITGSASGVKGLAFWESRNVRVSGNRGVGAEFPMEIIKSDISREQESHE